MRKGHYTKKLSIIIALAMVFLFSTISISMAVTLPLKEWGTNNNTVDVKLLQQSLNRYGNYDLAVDGIFGPATLSAVRNFQNANALVVDGIVGIHTWSKLSSIVGIYTINAAAGYGGTISPASRQVLKGNSITYTIVPWSGYKIQGVTVDGVSVGARTAYTFSNVTANHSINATFAVSTAGNDITNFWQNRSTWLQPLKGLQTYVPAGSFGSPRANGRAHAAVDLIAPSGRLVYAMTDGKVIRTSLFFENTYAVEVQNTDGTVARYCELAPAVSVGAIVHRGDVIGKIITNWGGSSMLHLEMYKGTASGSLTQASNTSFWYVPARNYERRADLIDPTGAVNLPVK
ncbi:MAG TPA: peptidoglycan-binding protein [Syntrophomonadaceae bacterium]|nr:peptidoglycan-binding protein [Syntrophomonadaceae bacterium]